MLVVKMIAIFMVFFCFGGVITIIENRKEKSAIFNIVKGTTFSIGSIISAILIAII